MPHFALPLPLPTNLPRQLVRLSALHLAVRVYKGSVARELRNPWAITATRAKLMGRLESRARSILPLSNLHRPLPFNRSLMPLSRIPSPFTSLSRKVNMQDRAVIYRNLSGEQPVALYRVGTAQPEAAKVVHQKIHSLTNNTFDLVVFHSKGEHPLEIQLQADSYPKACLSNHPTLMDGLDIAATSWFDLYSNSGWKTMQASTYFSADKSNPTIIRLRPSLRVALDPADCPGIDNFIGKQSRKRTGTALVSPPKKAARTETNPTPGHRRDNHRGC
ncbi:hypothetical protein B0H14DRAFT_3444975 [Mycena olivaceomarginata]|nr:hypothetical protein B0H14DRAFT_3444975 [Mycena olivaceomarginata]